MNQRLLALLAIGSTSVCAVVFTACGGDNNNGDGGSDATTNDVANDTTPPNDTGPGDTGGNDGGKDVVTTDSGCAPGPGCQVCCLQQYPDAAASVQANVENCACTTPGDCKSNAQCGNNLCKGNPANQACNACLGDKDAGDCRAKATLACVQDPSCQPLAQCVLGCGSVVTDAGGGG